MFYYNLWKSTIW